MKFWTDERENLLIELVAMRLSASKIAARLSGFQHYPDKGRSAVCGKIDRLRKKGRIPDMAVASRTHKRGARRARKNSTQWRHKQAFGLVDKHTPPRLVADGFVPPADEPIPLEQRKTIQTLEDGDCRWPIGDPVQEGFYFCGAEKVEGLPYCRAHALRAYIVPDQRRRVREISSMPTGMKERENV